MSQTGGVFQKLPEQIGPYTVVDELGKGAQGTVYKARAVDGTVVAIKLMKHGKRLPAAVREAMKVGHAIGAGAARLQLGPEERKAFLEARASDAERESRAAAQIEREERIMQELSEADGFVTWLESGELPPPARSPYFVMRCLEGGTLEGRLSRGALDVDTAVALAHALASAMGRAHTRGIVHRDLKPANVLFETSGFEKPVISDLGMAKHFGTDSRSSIDESLSSELTKTGQAKGTLVYMAPEQAMDAKRVGPSADVFALGVILFECLTHELPFEGVTALEMLSRAARGDVKALRRLRPEAPKWLEEIVTRSLTPDPAHRFANGIELAQALETHRASEAASVEVAGERARADAPKRRIAALVALNAVFLGALVVLATLALRKGAPSTNPETAAPTSSSSPPMTATSPSPKARPSNAPRWYLDLPDEERPPSLPDGVRFGEEPRTYVNERDGSVLLFIPGGTFFMGSDEGDVSQRPRHEVELSPYFVGRDEVTYRQFAQFVDATHYVTDSERDFANSSARKIADKLGVSVDSKTLKEFSWKRPFSEAPDDLPTPMQPVVKVSWNDCMEYARWARLDLPTDAQWERAAAWDPKTRRSRRYPWGDTDPGPGTPLFANLADDSTSLPWKITGYHDGYARLAPVGSFPAGNAPCGARDMVGNADEWVIDGWDPTYYSHCPQVDPCMRAEQHAHVTRGGSWHHGITGVEAVSVTRRGWAPLDVGSDMCGFRVVRNLKK